MEVLERNDLPDLRLDRAVAEGEHVRPEMAFLAENPESFGLIPDACPLATKHLLIAANGRSAESGEYAPVYEMESVGIDGLLALYGDLLPDTPETVEALEAAFGDSRLLQAHPVSRYCATLAELTALQIMRNGAYGASLEQTRLLLGQAMDHSLTALQHRLHSQAGDLYWDEGYYAVSLGLCRIWEEGEGNYTVDVFAAGDFSMFLLDGKGMAPLWQTATPEIKPGHPDTVCAKRFRFHRDEPFAVLLVSESVCALNAAESRGLRSSPGRIWKYRLRLEDYFMRLITDCVREHEFGERATRFFVGRSHGRDSASGAMTVMRNGGSYDAFLTRCQSRLSELGSLMELMPNGYTPSEAHPESHSESRAQAETAYLRELLAENPPLSNRLTAALRKCVLRKLSDGEEPVSPPDAPDYLRLDRGTVYQAFRVYDSENDGDRAAVEANRRALREYMAEHWVSLRPALLSHSSGRSDEVSRHCRIGDRMYRSCMEMNGELTRMLLARSRRILEVETLLTRGLERITAEGNDWIYGRANGDRVGLWADALSESIPAALDSLKSHWQKDTEEYRSRLSAYTGEREALFRHDTRPGLGFFAEDWQRILEGSLPESRWALFCGRLADDPDAKAFADMMDSLHRISKGTGALLTRIRSRAAESRVARELADRPELRVAALRGAAYEDPDWGEEITAVMDTAIRNEFRAMVRRWGENRELLEKQRQAYLRYSTMYGEFVKP